MPKKILVAIDGSAYSTNSLNYLAHLFAADPEYCVHLFSIVSGGAADQNWMFDVDPLRSHSPAVEQRIAVATRYLRDASARLQRQGFSAERVTFSAQPATGSIAQVLLHAAEQGLYDALLVGRRGVGKVGEMFFGSVSASLLHDCHRIPLWIIDGEVRSSHFLMAVNCSPESLLAADHLAYILGGTPGRQIFLYHSEGFFGNQPAVDIQRFHDQWGKEWCDTHLDPPANLFGAHTALLTQGGIPAGQIIHLETQRTLATSSDLLQQAKNHGCGTIILGRRSADTPKGFLGGVSDRTLSSAQNIAVWLVG